MASVRSHTLFRLQPSIHSGRLQNRLNIVIFRTELAPRFEKLNWYRLGLHRGFVSRASGDSLNSEENLGNPDTAVPVQNDNAQDSKNPLSILQGTASSFPPAVFMMKSYTGNKIWIWVFVAISLLIVAIRANMVRKSRKRRPGSVADLIRRGQLKSDRRGISKPLKYEDPFNNPYVKIGKSSSTVEMCGKVYKLAPVTLTEEERAIHQKRRSRAYQWKRPKVFLKEGDQIPPDVDPDAVRWIPANHPFATTVSDMDEGLAQNNVYQKHGVPFRIRAEHEALQRKLEALQSDETVKNVAINGGNDGDFQRSFKFSPSSDETAQKNPPENHTGNPNSFKQVPRRSPPESKPSHEEA